MLFDDWSNHFQIPYTKSLLANQGQKDSGHKTGHDPGLRLLLEFPLPFSFK